MHYVLSLVVGIAALTSISAASASSDYCKQVTAKPTDKLTQDNIDKCKGPIIAAAMCKGWKEGKAQVGCPDRQTTLTWLVSSDTALRERASRCSVGMDMDTTCTKY